MAVEGPYLVVEHFPDPGVFASNQNGWAVWSGHGGIECAFPMSDRRGAELARDVRNAAYRAGAGWMREQAAKEVEVTDGRDCPDLNDRIRSLPLYEAEGGLTAEPKKP